MIKDQDGHSVSMLGICHDITVARNAELAASEYRRELLHLARVATAGEMATVMAHELNQPLAAIALTANACARLNATGAIDSDEFAEHLADISAQAKRASEIIRLTRNLVRKAPATSSAIDLNRVIRDAVSLTAQIAQHQGIDVDCVCNESLPRVMGVEVQLGQLVLNLIRNAETAVAGNPKFQRRIAITTSVADGDRVVIEVADNGPGIPPALKERIFEPFFTTSERGLGMGLSICRTIAETHNGILSCEIGAGKGLGGATFRVVLPASAM